ncbi:MAG TPA: c-type cytochrome [Chitinophagaceae bacterium]|nr:c-type cytochrome [Chitinophagaceae bacterium]
MPNKNKIIVTLSFLAFVTLGVAAVKAPQERNLKVLPKDISDEKLDSIMQTYNKALGVKCEFCHVKSKVYPGTDIDYRSDAEPMKENARDMMRMTIEINTNHFYFNKSIKPEYLNTITCKTCHRGEAFPPED